MWEIRFTSNAEKDKKKLKQIGLETKAKNLLILMMDNPFQNPPAYEKLVGDLKNYYSRRINIKHRLVYCVDEERHRVIVHSMWSHYER